MLETLTCEIASAHTTDDEDISSAIRRLNSQQNGSKRTDICGQAYSSNICTNNNNQDQDGDLDQSNDQNQDNDQDSDQDDDQENDNDQDNDQDNNQDNSQDNDQDNGQDNGQDNDQDNDQDNVQDSDQDNDQDGETISQSEDSTGKSKSGYGSDEQKEKDDVENKQEQQCAKYEYLDKNKKCQTCFYYQGECLEKCPKKEYIGFLQSSQGTVPKKMGDQYQCENVFSLTILDKIMLLILFSIILGLLIYLIKFYINDKNSDPFVNEIKKIRKRNRKISNNGIEENEKINKENQLKNKSKIYSINENQSSNIINTVDIQNTNSFMIEKIEPRNPSQIRVIN